MDIYSKHFGNENRSKLRANYSAIHILYDFSADQYNMRELHRGLSERENGGFTPCRQLRKRNIQSSYLRPVMLMKKRKENKQNIENPWLSCTTCLGYSGPVLFSGPHKDNCENDDIDI